MAKKLQTVHKKKANGGAEVNVSLQYYSHSENASMDKIRIEQWLNTKLATLLGEFHMTFPGV